MARAQLLADAAQPGALLRGIITLYLRRSNSGKRKLSKLQFANRNRLVKKGAQPNGPQGGSCFLQASKAKTAQHAPCMLECPHQQGPTAGGASYRI